MFACSVLLTLSCFRLLLFLFTYFVVYFLLLIFFCLLLLSDLVWIAFNTTMIYFSISVIKEGFEYPEYSPTLDWVMAYVFMIFPVAFTLMNVRIIQVNIMKYILKIEIQDVDKIEVSEKVPLDNEVT